MANAIVTFKIMPESPDVDLVKVEHEALKEIELHAGKGDTKVEIEPIAFGLKAIKIIFIVDEKLGSPDDLALKIEKIEGVNSVEVIDVRRAIG
ncbi:MAG: elongation factor 1-beta [Candidatus Woesearchaeota archaeon]|jgi:elongation factor 1-beta